MFGTAREGGDREGKREAGEGLLVQAHLPGLAKSCFLFVMGGVVSPTPHLMMFYPPGPQNVTGIGQLRYNEVIRVAPSPK